MQHILIRTRLDIVAEDSISLLPRVLQILSRRGCLVREISTDQLENGRIQLTCYIEAPEQWTPALPGLIRRLIDVDTVAVSTPQEATRG